MSNNKLQPAYHLSRRTLLRMGAMGATVVAGGGASWLLQACLAPTLPGQTIAVPGKPAGDSAAPFSPDIEIKLTARPGSTSILPGAPTPTWSYWGEVIQGDANAVTNLSDSYLGPILRLRQGQKVRIHFQNELPEESIIHWHGLVIPPEMDGHPSTAVGPGESYLYEFEVRNRAGTYWFHPHPHGTTAAQVIKGLAGLLLIEDEEEAKLAVPRGEFDLPLILQDRTFDTRNQFVYNLDALSGMPSMHNMGNMDMAATMGFLGEKMLVNGQADFTLPVATRVYRLRLLNGSNSRIYKLAWSNGTPLTVIATDGGLLEKPMPRDYVTLAPGERVDLWADFSQVKPGGEIKLRSLAYSGVEAGMIMGGMMMPMAHDSGLPNGAAFDILTVRVERQEVETLALPVQLSTFERYQLRNAVNAAAPRPFALTMMNMQWLINGKQFEMEAVDESETVQFATLEVWEFINQQGVGLTSNMSGGGHHGHQGASTKDIGMESMMSDFMAHPMHIHGVQFQVVERQIDAAYAAGWETVQAGFVDEGWKDTVLVMPGERVKVLIRFNEYPGRYLVHCHNLEHESMGMMRNYLIRGGSS